MVENLGKAKWCGKIYFIVLRIKGLRERVNEANQKIEIAEKLGIKSEYKNDPNYMNLEKLVNFVHP